MNILYALRSRLVQDCHKSSSPYRIIGLVVALLMLVGSSVHSEMNILDRMKSQADSLQNILEQTDSTGRFSDKPTLEEYLAYLLTSDQSVKSAFYGWRAALEKTGYAGALPDPVVSFGRFGEEVQTRVGPQNGRFGIKQALPWPGRLRASKAVAKHSAAVAYHKLQTASDLAVFQIKTSYYQIYLLRREIVLTEENMALLEFWESVTHTRYKVSLQKYPDLIKVQIELGRLENRITGLQDQLNASREALLARLDLPRSITFEDPEKIDVEVSKADVDAVLQLALLHNPDLASLKSGIDRAESQHSLARSKSRPGFVFGFDYLVTGEALNPAMEGSGDDPWMVSVGISLPIYFGKNRAINNEAQAQLNASRHKHQDQINKLEGTVQNIVFRHNDALRQMMLYRDGLIPKAEQLLKSEFTAYQAGETDFLNLLESQRLLLKFQLQYEKSMVKLATAAAKIDLVTGTAVGSN